MKSRFLLLAGLIGTLYADGTLIDVDAFGESLGGWKKETVSYELSGSNYRTHKPETTPSPDGGMFVSLRIDHRRGWLSSDDHAVLEVTFNDRGSVVSARSTLAVQGKTITSDLIRSTATAGAKLTPVEGAVKVGSDLVADLSSKILRDNIVEAGRVSFPSAIRHNYNLLFQAVRSTKKEEKTETPSKPLEINSYENGEKKKE